MLKPTCEIDLIRGIVTGPAYDMAVDGERLIGEATDGLLTHRTRLRAWTDSGRRHLG